MSPTSQHRGSSHLIRVSYRDVLKALGAGQERHSSCLKAANAIRDYECAARLAGGAGHSSLGLPPRLHRANLFELFHSRQGFWPPSVSKASDKPSLGEIVGRLRKQILQCDQKSSTVYLILLAMREALSVRPNTSESRFTPSDVIKANRFTYTSPRLLNSLVVTVRNC